METLLNKEWIVSIVEQNENVLIRYAYSILKDKEKAKDVVQETFIKLCQTDPKKIKNHLKPWLFRVCRNKITDIYRKESRITEFLDGEEKNIPCDRLNPKETLLKKESGEFLQNLLQTLSEKDREVVRLKFMMHFSYKEISEITGYTVSNVGFILHSALKKLSTSINKTSFNKGEIS